MVTGFLSVPVTVSVRSSFLSVLVTVSVLLVFCRYWLLDIKTGKENHIRVLRRGDPYPLPPPPTHHIRTHTNREAAFLLCQREISYWIIWKKFLFVRSLSLPHVVNRNFNSPLTQFESFEACSVPAGEDASANTHITVHEKCGIVQEIWCTEKERKTVRVLRNIVAAFFKTFS